MAPTFEELATAFAHSNDQVIIAKIDVDAHKSIGSRFAIKGFPTIKWFPKGEVAAPIDFDAGRDLDSMAKFVTEKTGIVSKIKKVETSVTILTSSNFKDIVLDPKNTVLVEFFAPWYLCCI